MPFPHRPPRGRKQAALPAPAQKIIESEHHRLAHALAGALPLDDALAGVIALHQAGHLRMVRRGDRLMLAPSKGGRS